MSKEKIKGLLSGIIVMALILSLSISGAIYADTLQSITVFLDNNKIAYDVEPQIVNGRTMVPLRATFEALGVEVGWDNENKKITGTKGDVTIELTINQSTAFVNNKQIVLDTPAMILNGRALVPIRFIAEATGADVNWDNIAKQVMIISKPTSNSAITTTGSGKLSVDPKSIMDAYLKAIKEKDYITAYSYLCVKNKKELTQEEFVDWNQSLQEMGEDVNFSIDSVYEYKNAYEYAITRTFKYNSDGQTIDVPYNRYVIPENGEWKVLDPQDEGQKYSFTLSDLGKTYLLGQGVSKDTTKGFSLINKAIELYPENYYAYYHIAYYTFMSERNYTDCIPYFEKSIQYAGIDDKIKKPAYLFMGMAYANKGDFNNAVQVYEKALAEYPNDGTFKYYLEEAKQNKNW